MSENRAATQPPGAGIFSAADLKRRMAERETAKAAEELRRMQEQEEKQKAVMAEFHKPPDRTPEQLMELVMQLVDRAAGRGQSEIQVYRFPNALCSDRGRRINNSEPEWDKTLEGARLRILARSLEAARLPPQSRSARISGGRARRYRFHSLLEVEVRRRCYKETPMFIRFGLGRLILEPWS